MISVEEMVARRMEESQEEIDFWLEYINTNIEAKWAGGAIYFDYPVSYSTPEPLVREAIDAQASEKGWWVEFTHLMTTVDTSCTYKTLFLRRTKTYSDKEVVQKPQVRVSPLRPTSTTYRTSITGGEWD